MARLAARRFSSSLVPFVLSMVRRTGADAASLERRYLHARPADGQAAEVSLAELEGVFDGGANLVGDELFGLHCAQAMPRGGYGLLEFALRCAPTGRRALEQLVEYGALLNPLVRWSLDAEGEELSVLHRPPRAGGVGRHANIFTVARLVSIAREMLGNDLVVKRAWFAHSQRAVPDELQRFFGPDTTISFGRATNGVTFRASDFEAAPHGADPALNQALELHGAAALAQCEDDDVVERTRAVVLEQLDESPSLAGVAKRLHVGARTLQRRLATEGLSWATLLAALRREQAERLLERSDTPVSEVARRVGYRDVAAFVRAFRGWTGTTPGRFREHVSRSAHDFVRPGQRQVTRHRRR